MNIFVPRFSVNLALTTTLLLLFCHRFQNWQLSVRWSRWFQKPASITSELSFVIFAYNILNNLFCYRIPLQSLTDGAITLATFTSDPKFHLEFKNLKEMASWGLRMKQYDIPFHDVIAKQNLESQLDVLNRLCQVVDVDVGTIQEFCRWIN